MIEARKREKKIKKRSRRTGKQKQAESEDPNRSSKLLIPTHDTLHTCNPNTSTTYVYSRTGTRIQTQSKSPQSHTGNNKPQIVFRASPWKSDFLVQISPHPMAKIPESKPLCSYSGQITGHKEAMTSCTCTSQIMLSGHTILFWQ